MGWRYTMVMGFFAPAIVNWLFWGTIWTGLAVWALEFLLFPLVFIPLIGLVVSTPFRFRNALPLAALGVWGAGISAMAIVTLAWPESWM